MMNDKQEAQMMAENGISIPDIANELNVSVPTVYGWIQTDALAEQRRERNVMIVGAYGDGWSIAKLCSTFNVSQGTVYNVLHSSDTPLRRPRSNKFNGDRIVKMYLDGVKVSAIVTAVECSLTSIYRILDQRDIPRRRAPSP